ncbi:hypothetical protein XENTR_v10015775 [Xenopus tropicalis]|uniref:Cathelicidin-related peptide Oh-Cath n=1 Tax=Xenopus tropicalis TaxID=8364 RepID=A0A6I8RUJ0_XENTR
MESWVTVRLLLTVGAIFNSLSLVQNISIPDKELTQKAADLYNEQENVAYIFRPAENHPERDLYLEENPPLVRFIIKETECLRAETNTDADCSFKPDGETKLCTAFISDQTPVEVTCNPLPSEPQVNSKYSRTKRSTKTKKCKTSGCRFTGAGSAIAGVKPLRSIG